MAKETKKIEVKISENRTNTWNFLLELLVNQQSVGFFVTDGGNSVYIYPEFTDWSIIFHKNGNWDLE